MGLSILINFVSQALTPGLRKRKISGHYVLSGERDSIATLLYNHAVFDDADTRHFGALAPTVRESSSFLHANSSRALHERVRTLSPGIKETTCIAQ